jgi:hypothetical protein
MNRPTKVTMPRLHFLRNLSLGLAMFAAVATAHASPITFTETLTADGFFGVDDPFEGGQSTLTNSPVTFTGTGDTSAITHNGNEYDLILSSATVSVGLSGLSGFTFVTETLTDPIEVIVDTQFPFAGFEDSDGAEIVTDSSDFSTYNLAGPITVTGNGASHVGFAFPFLEGPFPAFLDITAAEGNSTFTAVASNTTVTPEPSTITMVGTSLLGLAGMVRRRMRRL